MCDFATRIADAQASSKKVCLRIGKTIYENCTIASNMITVKNIYDTSFELKLDYKHEPSNPTKLQQKKTSTINLKDEVKGFWGDIKKIFSEEKNGGIQGPKS